MGRFALAALSTDYIAWDNFIADNPEETVMKWPGQFRRSTASA